jgi:hypothetical protein
MTKSLFPVNDARNPKYYEKRAGYPLPGDAWYRNSSPAGDHVPMTFSKENFVRGFNLTCGEFYILRDALVPLLRNDNFYLRDFHKDMDAKWSAWNIWDQMNKHKLLQHTTPLKWRHDMLWKWISSTSLWIEKHKDELDAGNQPDKGWQWGPERITPKNAPPHVQFQHLKIQITNTADESKDDIVFVRSLINGDDKTAVSSPRDLDPEDLRLEHLHSTLVKHAIIEFDPKSHQLMWEYESADLVIETDADLVTALDTLRIQSRSITDVDQVQIWAVPH